MKISKKNKDKLFLQNLRVIDVSANLGGCSREEVGKEQETCNEFSTRGHSFVKYQLAVDLLPQIPNNCIFSEETVKIIQDFGQNVVIFHIDFMYCLHANEDYYDFVEFYSHEDRNHRLLDTKFRYKLLLGDEPCLKIVNLKNVVSFFREFFIQNESCYHFKKNVTKLRKIFKASLDEQLEKFFVGYNSSQKVNKLFLMNNEYGLAGEDPGEDDSDCGDRWFD